HDASLERYDDLVVQDWLSALGPHAGGALVFVVYPRSWTNLAPSGRNSTLRPVQQNKTVVRQVGRMINPLAAKNLVEVARNIVCVTTAVPDHKQEKIALCHQPPSRCRRAGSVEWRCTTRLSISACRPCARASLRPSISMRWSPIIRSTFSFATSAFLCSSEN